MFENSNYKEEHEKLIYSFNNTKELILSEKDIIQLIEESIKENEHKIAVAFQDKMLTYKELGMKVNILSRKLLDIGVRKGAAIAVIDETSIEAILSMLAIMKIGGIYVPIDPGFPKERIEYILDNSGIDIILMNENTIDLSKKNRNIINTDNSNLYQGNSSYIESRIDSRKLAYIIYTSGTTGNPKGVMIEHRSVTNQIMALHRKYDFRNLNHILMAALTFDPSIQQILLPLTTGGSLYLVSKQTKLNTRELINIIKKENIQIFNAVPSIVNRMVEDETIKDVELKYLILAGEEFTKELYEKIKKNLKSEIIINIYGPTEATINTTLYECKNIEERNKIPIGKPISNYKVYVFDKMMKVVPLNVVGQMYIGGDGLAQGYINNQELTKEKFIENPYIPGERIYETGDLVRWLPDGNLEFIGRKDHQVKIRGFRIELGEIESEIIGYDGVKEVAVIDKKDTLDNKYLCAFIVAEGKINNKEIKEYLSKKLPEYMIPARYVYMDTLPVTNNGKLDRNALPEPDNIIEIDNEYEAPSNKIEEELVRIWEEILDIKNIGINYNFFELGGDSIKAIQIVAKAQKHNMQIEVKDIFEAPRIKALKTRVKFINNEVSQKTIEGNVQLTSIQHWLLQNNKDIEHFNQAVMLYNSKEFNIDAVKSAFEAIVSHHDSLRMTYKNMQKEWIQYNRGINDKLFDIVIINLEGEVNTEKRIQQEANTIQSNIDIENGPLVKLGQFKTHNGDYLLIVIHHLVMDGISWRILFEDFDLAYRQAVEGKKILLQKKTNSFLEWAEKISKYANDVENEKGLKYWTDLEEKMGKIRRIPKDNEVENRLQINTDKVNVELNKEMTNKLLRDINKIYNTNINDILLTSLAMTISEWTGEKDVIINLEGHGREQIIQEVDISRTIGWFTTMYPVFLEIKNAEDISISIKETKETLRHIPNNGIEYGIFRYLKNDCNALKLDTEISFNYLGQFDSDISKDFEISKLSVGESISSKMHRPFAMDINCMIQDGVLGILFAYCNNEYKKETIQNIANKYVHNLEKVIEHCVNRTTKEYTPSDFTYNNISIKDIDELREMLST